MELISEEMVLEYKKCDLYATFMKNFNTAIKNMDGAFFDNVRCHTFYVQTPWEVAAEYRAKALREKIDRAWIDKYIPKEITIEANYH